MFGLVLVTAVTLAPDALHDQRFYAEPFATRAKHGDADPFDYHPEGPRWIQFGKAGVMTMQFGEGLEVHRIRAQRTGDRWVITVSSTDGRELARRFTWRWLDDGRAETDLLEERGDGSLEVVARLDETPEAVIDRHARALALDRLKSLSGRWLGSDDSKLWLRQDGTAVMKGETFTVRVYRARFGCDGPETMKICLLRGNKVALELALIDRRELVEAGAASEMLCMHVEVLRKSNGRTWFLPPPAPTK